MADFLALQTINQVMDWIEREIGSDPELGDSAVCRKTGTKYVEIVWDPRGFLWMDKEEPDLYMARFPTPEIAWMAFAHGLNQYRRGRIGRVHWRHRPELEFHERLIEREASGKVNIIDPGGYFVYARLVIDPEVTDG